ncbi:MAG: bifunctional adenosylcobinamide kinase/adenosylcobinamide-phosphate guanylyltransferase [Acidobacteriota bacterium]|nr:bifunctional adenosylcobinamide kinase/adenosylcobinamide-phosphate guanylyltransferase [Acidobacteriota bacterium]
MITMLTGGVKSGKSRRALDLAIQEWRPAPCNPVTFVATAEALDDEMKARIVRHREERLRFAGKGAFVTIEEPLELGCAVCAAGERVLIDCLPMWLNNIVCHRQEGEFARILDALLKGMVEKTRDCIVVTNETGMGNIPFDETVRRYNTLLADANRRVAAVADRVELLVSGIPLRVR